MKWWGDGLLLSSKQPIIFFQILPKNHRCSRQASISNTARSEMWVNPASFLRFSVCYFVSKTWHYFVRWNILFLFTNVTTYFKSRSYSKDSRWAAAKLSSANTLKIHEYMNTQNTWMLRSSSVRMSIFIKGACSWRSLLIFPCNGCETAISPCGAPDTGPSVI